MDTSQLLGTVISAIDPVSVLAVFHALEGMACWMMITMRVFGENPFGRYYEI